MAGAFTNKLGYELLSIYFQNGTEPTNLYLALVTDAPTVDTNTMSDLTECAAGNGYTSGGASLNRDGTDFDTLTEDDTNDYGYIQIKDITLVTASGGSVPSSGDSPRYIVLTDDNGTVADRKILASWDMGAAVTVPDGIELVAEDLELRVGEGA